MKRSSTIALAAIFVILLVVSYFFLKSPGERETSYTMTDNKLAVDSSQVQSIIIRKNGSITRVDETGGEWTVSKSDSGKGESFGKHFATDKEAVARTLGGLQKMKLSSIVSSNPNKQSIYQVDSTGTQVTVVSRNGKTVEFVLGQTAANYAEVYIRPVSSNNVYLAEGLMGWDVNRELRDWRDKKIFAIVKDSVHELTYSYPKERFTIRKDSVWLLEKDTASTDQVTAALHSLEQLRAQDFIDTSMDLTQTQLQLQLVESAPLTLSFMPLPPDSSRYVAKTSASPQLYIVGKWNITPFMKQKKDFLPIKKK